MDHAVLGIAEARASLSSIVDRLASDRVGRVVIGSHRKPEAMIVPYDDAPPPAPVVPLLETVRARADLIKRIALTSKIVEVSVFGSVARGEELSSSDIDFMVDTQDGASLWDLAQFEIDMELLFNRPVDVVTRAALRPDRDRQMLDDAVRL